MFRKLTRIKQKLGDAECVEILKNEKRGVLSLIGDGGYPYGVPMNHFYNEEDGRIYFHSGRTGHKIHAINACGKASFCVVDGGRKEEGDWALRFRSVIVFGTIETVEDRGTVYKIAEKLSRKFTDDEAYIKTELERSGPATLMFALVPEHITGKTVKES